MVCPLCGTSCTRFGHHRNGLQRYRCPACGTTYTESHPEAFRSDKYLAEQQGLLAIKLLAEGNSVRTVERVTRFHRNTVLKLLLAAGFRCNALLQEKISAVAVGDVQCDEIWGFVRKKESRRRGDEADFPYIGDAWTFVAIERNTKLVLTYHLGKRTLRSATQFMGKVAHATDPEQKFQLTTDGLPAYESAVAAELGERVDYAQLIKIYGETEPEERRRYSPPDVIDAIPKPMWGDPDEKRICASHVERQNLTMRMCMRRLTRLTDAFSKKWDNLLAALALHFAYYNFCRKHITLRGVTPAMAAGITDHVWDLEELLNV